MNHWSGIIQDWLFPPNCLLCGEAGMPGMDLCADCLKDLPFNTVACPRCALPLPQPSDLPCGHCQRRPPTYDSSLALLRYEEPARYLIRSLKFHARYPCARLLGQLLAQALGEREDWPELIIPVPLHPSRYRQRGFNQALEIARHLSRRLQIPLDYRSCIRQWATPSQTELDAKQRQLNVRRAFAVAKPIPARSVAIVDDVVTTGATVNAVATVLRRAGVGRIEVWACARR